MSALLTSLLLCIHLLALLLPFPSRVLAQANVSTNREDFYYRIETIPLPEDVVLEVGGLAFLPDGRLMASTRHGEIWALKDGQWKRWAFGLDEPMGICVTGPDQVVVAQRPETTRITDTDGDGEADLFETLADQWNYSGHYYEWNFGLVRDRAGNFWGTLACWFYPTQKYDKPPYSGWEIPPPRGYTPGADTAWRGWIYKLTPQGEFLPWASGVRSPNGLALSPEGDLFVSDNQGEYFGANPVHHVTQGSFHGHPTALLWGPDRVADPFSIPLEELDRRRRLPALMLPYGVMGQSISEMVWDQTGGKFGPFGGQMFIGDQTKCFVARCVLEKVDGEYQGAAFPFRAGFQCGVNRLVWAPDGSLLAGETDRGWGSIGGQRYGLQRVVWTGQVPMEIATMSLTPRGFDLTFTKPVDPATARDPAAYSLQHYHYHYHRTYGSPQVANTPVKVSEVTISADRKRVSLLLPELVTRKIYELHIRGLKAEDGSKLLHPDAYYTLNRLRGDGHL
ncbi:MAG: hypothetical protein HYY24_06260 [Verrucomicrobia bacterium]|nr:hypothetical protein [Verrucomicrobiota bacterium]